MTTFGDFSVLCRNVPSYPWCNLFYRQLLKLPTTLKGLSANRASAPVGINPVCGIPRVGFNGSFANIANIIVSGVSAVVVFFVILRTHRRKAAVGRWEIIIFLSLYIVTLILQLITLGSFIEQGSTVLVVFTALHAGTVAALFGALLVNGIVAMQKYDDGTPASLILLAVVSFVFFVPTTYISLDTALSISRAFTLSTPPEALHNIPLFVLTSIWPGVAALLYFLTMFYIVAFSLDEVRSFLWFLMPATSFILSQLAYFLLGKVICKGTQSKVDGSFVATLLETISVVSLWAAWTRITEGEFNWNSSH